MALVLIMLVLLGVMAQVLPGILKGRDPREMVETVMQVILGFGLPGGLVVLTGLMVWLRVLKGKKERTNSEDAGR